MTARVRLVLLDRDGTLNVKAPEGEYVTGPDQLRLLPGAAHAVRRLNDAGVAVAIVTNQRGIALGQMTEADLEAVHDRLRELLAAEGAHVDAIRHCPHADEACGCRKPQPGMLDAAARDLGVRARDAVMIGDSDTDVEAGRRAGTATVRLGVDAPSLAEAVDGLLGPEDPR